MLRVCACILAALLPAAIDVHAFAQAAGPPPSIGRQVNRTALWERTGRDLLHGFCNMYNFHVIHEPGSDFPYRAWFFGWAAADANRNIPGFTGCDAIFAARAKSLDGPWQVYVARGAPWDDTMTPARWRPVVSAQNTWYDEWHNGDPSVVKVDGHYYMAYSSTGHNKDRIPYGRRGDKDGSILCIMGAVSEDGVNWRKSSAPILIHAEDYGKATIPQGDSHLYGSYQRPSLLHEDGRFILWFDYWAPPPAGVSLGCAENRGDFLDPNQWKILRAGESPCLPNFPNPDVVRVGDIYYGFSDPVGYGTRPWVSRKITEAISLNGLDWMVLGHVDPDPDAPATHVPEAFVQSEGGATWLYVFYACQIGGQPYNYRYNRIRFMRRKVTEDELKKWLGLLQHPDR